MKKTAFALIGIAVLLGSTLLGVQPVNALVYGVEIQSPENGSYVSTNFIFTFKMFFSDINPRIQASVQSVICSYSVDDGEWKRAEFQKTITSRVFEGWVLGAEYSKPMHLSQGLHNIRITQTNGQGISKIYFVCGSTGIPILSPQNKTYNTREIQLDFVTNFPAKWVYCLDNQANITTNGDTILSGLSDGSHSIIVYNNDVGGAIGTSSIVQFTVNSNNAGYSPNQPTGSLGSDLQTEYCYAIAATLATIIIVSVSLIIHFKKYRR